MNQSRLKKWGGLGVALMGLGAMMSCSGEDDIWRVQANVLPKAMFQGTWYMRSTVTDVPATASSGFIGETGNMEKIRWEVQEGNLIAYRAYEEIPGTDSTKKSGQKNYKENPVATFKILSHFDIKRSYNPATGEQGNVIEENASDRPWYEREYLRVDWSESQVSKRQFSSVGGSIATSSVFYVQSHEKDNPDAMRIIAKDGATVNFDNKDQLSQYIEQPFDLGYFDMVGKYILEPETVDYPGYGKIPLCWFQGYQTHSCGPEEVKVRTAFLKVKPSNFEPVVMDNRDMGKFGFFRTERLTYDRKYAFTESGRIYLANVHNIWKAAYKTKADGSFELDANGNKIAIPLKDREPKAITYHLSPEYPCEMIAASQQVAGSWNKGFRRAVAVAKGLIKQTSGDTDKDLAGISLEQVPNMFVLNTNGWVQKTKNDDWTCNNLTYDPAKVEAQLGDLRYSVLAWVNDRQISGPLGYGPSSPDPETGEIISGLAYMYGAGVDEYANRSLEIVRLLNNDPKFAINGVITGEQVKDYILKNQRAIEPATNMPASFKNLDIKQAQKLITSPRLASKLNAIRKHGFELATPGGQQARLERIRGTGLEQHLVDEEIIKGVANHVLPGVKIDLNTGNLPKEVVEAASPLNWMTPQARMAKKVLHDHASKNCIWLREFADDSILGLALEVWKKYGGQAKTDADYHQMWQYLREQIFRGVAEHEVGHSVGLRHNFSGSYDSINYFNKYWDLREKGEGPNNIGGLIKGGQVDMAGLLNQQTQNETQKKGRMREFQYSSIMDYGGKFNADIHGIGKYDEAAIAFGYTGFVEAFATPTTDAKSVLQARYGDCETRYESRPNPAYTALPEDFHYSTLWNILGQTKGVTTRKFVPWSDLKNKQQTATKNCEGFVAKGGTVQQFASSEPARDVEVPYMFCGDEFVGAAVSCHRWDEGADPREQVQYVENTYKNYYFFNNYKRDRFGFDSGDVYGRVADRYFAYLPNIYQHWLFNVAFGGVQDEILSTLWQFGTWQGVNLLMETMTKPEYGTYCRSNGVECNAAGTVWQRVGANPDAKPGQNQVTIGRGDGRRRYGQFDYSSGYYFYDQLVESGHFWEYLAASRALVQSEGTFIGVEVGTDFNTYIIPYYIVFDDELTKQFEGVITEDDAAIAPRVVNGQLRTLPAAPIALQNGNFLDPSNAAELKPADMTAGQPIRLGMNFTQKFYALLTSASEFRSTYSLRYIDRLAIWRAGTGEDMTPANGWVADTCEDPIGGQVYANIRPVNDPAGDGAAGKMLAQCRDVVTQYNRAVAQGGVNSNAGATARRDVEDKVEWLNFLRMFHDVFDQPF